MLFPNEVQSAVLFDRRVTSLDDIVQTFLKIEQAASGARFNMPECKTGVFYRLFGGDELMITLEHMDQPANMAVFEQPLASVVTGRYCPDIRHQLTRNRSHILINVSHGVLGGVARDPAIAAILQQVGMKPEGYSLPQFKRRLEVLGLLTRIVHENSPAQVVHWTQSNQLFPAAMFDGFAGDSVPSHLHVHPYLFGRTQDADGNPQIGIRTFGARHFIGREILIEPNSLPWVANYEVILAMLRVATIENGYVIPDTDTFGPDDGSLSYRAIHHEAAENDVPLIELVPLLHREFGFQSDDYVPRERVFDDRSLPVDLMPADQDDKQALANEWREKRALAEGIGARFEVRARHGALDPDRTPPPSPGNRFRRLFGRKGVG